MKIRILSDLHLEHNYDFKYEWISEDVLFLAGDITTHNNHYEILDRVPEFVEVFIVAGNHEYYHRSVEHVNKFLSELNQPDVVGNYYRNVHFLNNTAFDLTPNISVFGGTMFTDFALDGNAAKIYAEIDAQRFIADFRFTKTNGRCWSIEDHVSEYNEFLRAYKLWLKESEGKYRICMSHFVPLRQHIHPRFKGSSLNPYFTADMEQYMGWEGLWIHGHTHDSFDSMIGDTRVICNPYGYGSENTSHFKNNLILEI